MAAHDENPPHTGVSVKILGPTTEGEIALSVEDIENGEVTTDEALIYLLNVRLSSILIPLLEDKDSDKSMAAQECASITLLIQLLMDEYAVSIARMIQSNPASATQLLTNLFDKVRYWGDQIEEEEVIEEEKQRKNNPLPLPSPRESVGQPDEHEIAKLKQLFGEG